MSSKKTIISSVIIFTLGYVLVAQVKMPPPIEISKKQPIVYIGERQTDKRFYDGALPHVVGAHHYQIFRANRGNPVEDGEAGWTYNHQPYLAYWNGKFYVQWIQGEIHEHVPPTRVLLSISKDGRVWSKPVILFPEYDLPEINDNGEIIPKGTKAVMHHRMGFYISPNGKLLALGFYGFCGNPRKSPNDGRGIGRVVREIKADGTFGPIYFIRYNRHAGWNEKNTNFPYYRESKDTSFINACDSLLANKLITLQWWEEDRANDGFYSINPSLVFDGERFIFDSNAGKAFNFYTRPDGIILGMWKFGFAALSPDRGKTWTEVVRCTTLLPTGAKIWGQRTKDGRYAIIYNHSPSLRNRFPMAILIGEDGHTFDKLYAIRGDVPPMRYSGHAKNPGVQYFRGIIEGNGDPPGNYMWVVYSVNKEDIWISRITIPVLGEVSSDEDIQENFENINDIGEMDRWNIYIPYWGDVRVVSEGGNKYIELVDEEPYDYTYIERIFSKASRKHIEFRFRAPKLPDGLAVEIEVQNQKGERALRLKVQNGWLWFNIDQVSVEPAKIKVDRWNHVSLYIDCDRGIYKINLNNSYIKEVPIPTGLKYVERIVFRTGPYRNFVPSEVIEHGPGKVTGLEGEDLPGSEKKTKPIILQIDDIKIKNQ